MIRTIIELGYLKISCFLLQITNILLSPVQLFNMDFQPFLLFFKSQCPYVIFWQKQPFICYFLYFFSIFSQHDIIPQCIPFLLMAFLSGETAMMIEITRTIKTIIPEVRETLVFKTPRYEKSPCCTRLSLHITVHSESIPGSIVNLVVATAVGAISQMIDARPWFGLCSFSWAKVSLQRN